MDFAEYFADFWSLPTVSDVPTMLDAIETSTEIYQRSLAKTFVSNNSDGIILRPSLLGKPAIELFAKRFLPDIFDGDGFETRILQIFHVGNCFEADLHFHLIRTGQMVFTTQAETEWNGLLCHADFIVKFASADHPHILELKTTNSNYFDRCNRDGITDYRGHLTQGAIYQEAFGLPVIFVVYDKATSNMTWIEPTIAELESALYRAKRIVDVWNQVTCWEDVFLHLQPPPPRKEWKDKRWTGRYLVPPSLYGSPVVPIVYEMIGKHVVDYRYPDKYNHLKPELPTL